MSVVCVLLFPHPASVPITKTAAAAKLMILFFIITFPPLSKAVFYCFCETAFSSYRSLAGIFLFQILTLFSLRSALRMYNQKAEADGPQRPSLPTSISAAITQMILLLSPSRIPVKIFGTAEGSTTVKNTLNRLAPIQDAASIRE